MEEMLGRLLYWRFLFIGVCSYFDDRRGPVA